MSLHFGHFDHMLEGRVSHSKRLKLSQAGWGNIECVGE